MSSSAQQPGRWDGIRPHGIRPRGIRPRESWPRGPTPQVQLRVRFAVHGDELTVLLDDDEVSAAEAYSDRDHRLSTTRRNVTERIQALARWWPAADRVAEHMADGAVRLSAADHAALSDGLVSTQLVLRGITVDRITDVVREAMALPVLAHGSDNDSLDFTGDSPFGLHWRIALPGPTPDAEHVVLDDDQAHRLRTARGDLIELLGRHVQLDPDWFAEHCPGDGSAIPALEALRAMSTGRLHHGGRTLEVALDTPLVDLRDRLTGLDESSRLPAPDQLQADLRAYQLQGFRWLELVTSLGLGGCLADDMGLGKTLQVIALVTHRVSAGVEPPTLVVCPASVLGNWQRELERFAPHLPVRRFHGTERDLSSLPRGAVVLTTYGTLRADVESLAATRWSMVVADEAQYVKNPRAATAKALRELGAPVRVALTGTPVENDLEELWAILDWTTPGLLGSRHHFRKRWASPIEGGSQIAADELASVVRPLVLRRRKIDPGIAPELPERTVTDLTVVLQGAQRQLYDATVTEGMAQIRAAESMRRRGLVLALITRCKQICADPRLVGARDHVSAKLEVLDDLINQIVHAEGRVLVFTQYVAMGELLVQQWREQGLAHEFLHGAVPTSRRQRMVEEFQAGRFPILLLSLRAGGTGLNLTAADHVVHYDRWWNPAVEDQATDRAHRIGQTRAVQVHRLIATGTIEDGIADLIERKRALADAVVNTEVDAVTELSDDELEVLLRHP